MTIQRDTELIVIRNGQICSLPPEVIAKLLQWWSCRPRRHW